MEDWGNTFSLSDSEQCDFKWWLYGIREGNGKFEGIVPLFEIYAEPRMLNFVKWIAEETFWEKIQETFDISLLRLPKIINF